MDERRKVALVTALMFGLVVWIPVLIGAREPIDLLVPGSRSPGGPGMVAEYGDAVPDDFGYDGQAVYVIARELPDLHETSAALDTEPRYRMQRILLPVLASPAGSGTALIVSLQLWSLLGAGLAAWALATLAQASRRPVASALLAASPLLLPLMLTTTETLGTGLILCAVVAVSRDRLLAATALFALAGLAREAFLIGALAAGVILLARRRVSTAIALVAASAAPALAWWLYLQSTIGGEEDTTGPLSGPLRYGPAIRIDSILAFAAAVVLCALGAWLWRNRDAFAAATCAGFLLVSLSFGSVNPIAILRVPAPALCLAILALVRPTQPGIAHLPCSKDPPAASSPSRTG